MNRGKKRVVSSSRAHAYRLIAATASIFLNINIVIIVLVPPLVFNRIYRVLSHLVLDIHILDILVFHSILL